MYNTITTKATLSLDKYIRIYRDVDKFIGFCRQCNSYAHCWSCPPFDFDVDEYMSNYDTVTIIGTKITPDKSFYKCEDRDRNIKLEDEIISSERRQLDSYLLDLERANPNSRAFFAGVCHCCAERECTRKRSLQCRHPEDMRYSLEAFGFDIVRTASELLGIDLKWSKNGAMPEYYTLVSGLFTKQ